jgi:Zn-dependent M32 family carboxypeptidase
MPNRRDAGTFLKERVFAPGQTMRWDQLIEHATGSPLSPAVLARDLAV